MFGPAEILLVEDNPGDQRLVTEALLGTNSRVHVVADGMAAISFLQKVGGQTGTRLPCLIILDLNLPQKSGRDVLRELKTDRNLRRIPVIVFSSSMSDDDISACYELHANCYVTKPLDLEDFFETVNCIFHFWIDIARTSDSNGLR